MKVKEINKLIKEIILPHIKGYAIHRDLIYRIEGEYYIKGYNFESSGNGEYDLAVWCFIQPLFTKSETLYFTFGDRLKYRKKMGLFKTKELEWWDATKENWNESFQSILQSILSEGEKYLASFKGPGDFFKKFRSSAKGNIRVYEGVAYTSILMKDQSLQDKMLKGLIKEAKNDGDLDWVHQIRADAELLLSKSTQEERIHVLKEWANETILQLKLPELKLFN
jgi:hypothetical protein